MESNISGRIRRVRAADERIAVVTGGNRGIGLEICRQLADKGVRVVLTARDRGRGEKAAGDLKRQGLDVDFHLLDVTDSATTRDLADYLDRTFGRVDVLVNNAGIFIDDDYGSADVPEQIVRKTFETDFFGPLLVSQALIPLLRKSTDARIINLSSGLGQLSDAGGGYPSYSMAKAALNMLSAKMAADLSRDRIKVNSMCPGWVRTEMGGPGAPRSVEKGADTAVWLATAARIPNGVLIRDRRVIDW